MREEIGLKRLRVEQTAYYAYLPPAKASGPVRLVMALHGYGENCRRVARLLCRLTEGNVAVVAPQAPNAFYLSLRPKKVGFTWLTQYERDQAVADVNGYLDRLLDEVGERCALDPAKVVLFGFSQGASMAYRFAVHRGGRIGGLVSCCADLPPDIAEVLPNLNRFRVLLARGKDDPLVPEGLVAQAEEGLQRHGYPCKALPYDGGHEISGDFVQALSDWLKGLPV